MLMTMKKTFFFLLVFAVVLEVNGQDQDPKALQATAKEYTKQGDYNNAILVLNRALEKDRNNLEFKKRPRIYLFSSARLYPGT